MANLKPLDSFTLTASIIRNFSCHYSPDDRILIQTEMGIYIISLRANLSSSFKYFSCKKLCFQPSDYTPCANIEMDVNNFVFQLDRDDLYETTLRTELSATIKGAKPIAPLTKYAEWSPKGMMGKTDCILGVFTNLNNVELYARHIDENNLLKYVHLGNVVQCLIQFEKQNWKPSLRIPGNNIKLKEYKKRVEKVAATAFTWTHLYKVGEIDCSSICMGHYDGSVTIFRIESLESNSTELCRIQYLGRYSTELDHITSLYWHQTKNFGGGLCIGDVNGKVSVLNVGDLDKNVVFADNETAFYKQVDKVVDKITVTIFENYTIIIVVKQNILLFYALNSLGQVFDFVVYDAKNFYVTGLHTSKNTLYVLTFNGILKKLELVVINSKLKINDKVLPIKFDSARFRTHGLFVSSNEIIFGIIAHPCRILDRKINKIHVFLYYDTNLKPFEMLMENQTGCLTTYWDIFEVLRLTCLKEQKFPWLGIDPNLNYDNLTLLQIKTLKHVAELSESVFSFIPKIPNYDIKPHIILQYLLDIKLVVKRLKNLLSSGRILSRFQLQSIDVQVFYLKEMVLRNILAKANVGKNFVEEMYEVISVANEIRYPSPPQCFWCGETIIGTLCLPPHSDSRCCYSFMQITGSPGFFCHKCSSVAHEEIAKELDPILCPYCDIPMCKMKKIDANIGPVPNLCFNDCCEETVEFEDVEENPHEFVAISSDSEDEDKDKLGELYVKVSNMALEDIGKEMEEKYSSDLSDSSKCKKSRIGSEQ